MDVRWPEKFVGKRCYSLGVLKDLKKKNKNKNKKIKNCEWSTMPNLETHST